jgi:hypothetical protein
VPHRVEIEVDIRPLPGVSPTEVNAMLTEATGDLAERVEMQAQCADEGRSPRQIRRCPTRSRASRPRWCPAARWFHG